MKAEMGTIVSAFAIDKLYMAKGQKIRAGIISKKIRVIKIHYLEGVGYFHCFEGSCCDDQGIPSIRYMYPIITYPCDNNGKLTIEADQIPIQECSFKILAVGRDDNENLITKDEIQIDSGSDITKQDLLISCVDSEYQKKDYDIAGPCLWRNFLEKELYKKNMILFHSKSEITMGRFFDEAKYKKALTFATPSEPTIDRPALGELKSNPNTKQIEDSMM